jgi:hypothetical protein
MVMVFYKFKLLINCRAASSLVICFTRKFNLKLVKGRKKLFAWHMYISLPIASGSKGLLAQAPASVLAIEFNTQCNCTTPNKVDVDKVTFGEKLHIAVGMPVFPDPNINYKLNLKFKIYYEYA